MNTNRRWKCRAMDAEENQHQVSLGATPRLEIAARFPLFHRLDRAEEK